MINKFQNKRNPRAFEDVLLKCRRRCCICFGLKNDHGEKIGQISHLDHNPANNSPENLAFLCFEHHDRYDSQTSQSKSLQINEVKAYREKLYEFIENNNLQNIQILKKPKKLKSSKPLSARALNAHLTDKPHKCNYCGYSFSIMPELEEGKTYFVKTATCPKCGSVDEVRRFYHG